MRTKGAANVGSRGPRLLRFAAVKEQTGLGRTTIMAKVRAGTFPKPFKISERAIAWVEDEVLEWCAARIAERGLDAE